MVILSQSDIFSLGATMYEVCTDEALPADGEGWHKIRNDKLDFMSSIPPFSSTPATAALITNNNTPRELQDIIRSMMSRDPSTRPSAAELLRKRPLLSEQEKQLIAEKNKVKSLEEQKFHTSFTPGRNKKRLVRSSTWDAGYLFR